MKKEFFAASFLYDGVVPDGMQEMYARLK